MTQADENTTVVIVGAGVAGLALGTFLLRGGVRCVIVEKHAREHVENRHATSPATPTSSGTPG
ncbi:FAD-dependent monooxygenase [Pseudonocardia acaciae]|uniref:FAD-dependent monooxygenase n=1 Tax=Pseudonocardia acaciae TaxID=551276 RepID=UPI001FE17028|nr:FAD-dependent monooxygenase [Pseudonocardia acaciae]